MTLIEASLSRKLTDVLGDVKVFPDEIPLKYTQDGEAKPNCTLPAVTYRIVAGDQSDSINRGKTGLCNDTYLVEAFGMKATECQALRRKLFDEFTGPVDKQWAGRPVRWADGGPKVRWAVASEPSGDTEAATTDAHDVLRFVQMLLTITYHKGACP